MCAYICEVTSGYLNPEFESIMLCMIENKCMGSYPQDGRCIAKESDGVKSITSMEQVRVEQEVVVNPLEIHIWKEVALAILHCVDSTNEMT